MNNSVEQALNEYLERILRRDQHHELEIRIGRYVTNEKGTSKFDTLLKKDRYFKLMDSYNDTNDFLQFDDYVFYEIREKRFRSRFDKEGKLLESVKKTKRNEKIVLRPEELHDLRFSISKEEPCEIDIQFNKKKSTRKRRKKFFYPYSVVDFTITNRGRYSDYRIEIELNDPEYNQNEFLYIKKELLMHIKRLSS